MVSKPNDSSSLIRATLKEEFVEDAKTGYIVPFEEGEQQFIECLLSLESNRELLYTLQCNALEKRQEFAPPILNL